ncbi:urease accessory protein UreF [Ruegeria profundi]|uniref:urease accessory protein UreF n=1 Tax=Ruegeria profundi TaxID=1685378 RepID=UPI001CD58B90|nr:urease accessory UreF family protein [Ruegeria profundi]MCA0930118.1 urease accessory protein UreF [Ruegeria profundi]
MATAGRMAIPTNADILTLTQWLSPAYPVGGFAYSHGLEWAIECGAVGTVAEVGSWITDVIQHGSGHSDSVFLAAAYRAETPEKLGEIDQTARAFCASSERLSETVLLGDAFCTVTSDVWALDLRKLTYPVAIGHAAAAQKLPLGLTAQMFLQAFLANLVACATRLVPLGQTDAQRLICDLTPLCQRIANDAIETGLNELSSTAFLSDIASMKHETQYSRIFRT